MIEEIRSPRRICDICVAVWPMVLALAQCRSGSIAIHAESDGGRVETGLAPSLVVPPGGSRDSTDVRSLPASPPDAGRFKLTDRLDPDLERDFAHLRDTGEANWSIVDWLRPRIYRGMRRKQIVSIVGTHYRAWSRPNSQRITFIEYSADDSSGIAVRFAFESAAEVGDADEDKLVGFDAFPNRLQ